MRVVAALRDVSKQFGSVQAANNLNLEINQGEFLSFLGPSGCGKTTALRILAGFETPSNGKVLIDDEVVNDLEAHLRPVNMVFQHYALFPHMSVSKNIAYGLRQQRPRLSASVINDKVTRALELVRLNEYGNRRIWELSGGQQQRVALARAIINEPKMLLLDEPLAALDRKLRKEMQIELQNLQRTLGMTFVLVTHDQEEALSMSDRICIMQDGQIVQIGTPQELYDQPVNRYVASFVGTSNFFEGEVTQLEGSAGSVRISSGHEVVGQFTQQGKEAYTGTLCIRPEQIQLHRAPENNRALPVRVKNRIFLGDQTEYLVSNESLGDFLVLAPRQSEFNEGSFNVDDQLYASLESVGALIL